MENRKNYLRTACAILAALLISMIVLNIASSEALTEANRRIGSVYQKAFYESCQLTEGISVNYRKLLVAPDNAQMQTLLAEITRQCQGTSGNLSLLPLGQQIISATLKFVNQAEDFAETLSVKLASGDGASSNDYDTMRTLSDGAAKLSQAMGALLERFESGETWFDEADFAAAGDENYAPLSNAADDYPSLLYDGAYSDGIAPGNYEMLRFEDEVTVQQAEAVLRALIPAQNIRYLGESNPEVPCYEFSLRSGKYSLSAAVTKMGGHVLYLLAQDAAAAETMGEEELCTIAEDFLRARGYGDVAMRYYSAHNGVLTVNFAAVQDDVILYPDLIKIQLSMEDGSVIGLDAKAYLKNHRTRNLAYPAIDAQTAMAAAGERLDPQSAKLCLIPQNRKEYLCYEVLALNGGDSFLVYIDAQTGAERDLKQLLSRENGTLVM